MLQGQALSDAYKAFVAKEGSDSPEALAMLYEAAEIFAGIGEAMNKYREALHKKEIADLEKTIDQLTRERNSLRIAIADIARIAKSVGTV